MSNENPLSKFMNLVSETSLVNIDKTEILTDDDMPKLIDDNFKDIQIPKSLIDRINAYRFEDDKSIGLESLRNNEIKLEHEHIENNYDIIEKKKLPKFKNMSDIDEIKIEHEHIENNYDIDNIDEIKLEHEHIENNYDIIEKKEIPKLKRSYCKIIPHFKCVNCQKKSFNFEDRLITYDVSTKKVCDICIDCHFSLQKDTIKDFYGLSQKNTILVN